MKIVLATGIYPPDIGGPATYAYELRSQLVKMGVSVVVLTYAQMNNEQLTMNNYGDDIIYISKSGGSIMRWFRYARALKKHAGDADVVIAFSSVSCGVPVKLARLRKPKKFLRLGGDFFWERYTDRGGALGLRNWYEQKFHTWVYWFTGLLVYWLMGGFDHVVFSTRFQEKIYEENYKELPEHSVIENAVPAGTPVLHEKHDPFRVLFMGRFVGFKNLPTLLFTIRNPQSAIRFNITFVGDGPMKPALQNIVKENNLEDKVTFLPPVHGEEKKKVFAEHDLLVIPSVTEISPNVALEARAAGLPVLLSSETGLSNEFTDGMVIRKLVTLEEIAGAIEEVIRGYDQLAEGAAKDPSRRGWDVVAEEWLFLQ